MTLRGRLLLATFILCVAITLALSLVVRAAWQQAEAQRFESEFSQAVTELSSDLTSAPIALRDRLRPLCDYDPLVDSALIGIESETLASRLLAIKLGLKEHALALSATELALVSDTGELLAGTWAGTSTGPTTGDKAERLRTHAENPGLRPELPLALEASCIKERDGRWVAIVVQAEIQSELQRAEARHHLSLRIEEVGASDPGAPRDAADQFVQAVGLSALGGRTLVASRSKAELSQALSSLDLAVLSAAAGTLAVALIFTWILARGLARPVTEFAQRTRVAMQGSVVPIPLVGGPELKQAAAAFNQTLSDLQDLKRRLYLTERIAARREVARQIAHEIKNPLTPIRTSIETLRKLNNAADPRFSEFFDEATQTVLSEVRRIGVLVKNFADYARLPSPEPQLFDLRAHTQQLVALHQDLGATVTLEPGPPLLVEADPDQIRQVLTNLVKNALEATAHTLGPEVSLRLSGAETDALISLSVTDNGPGVPPSDIATLFEPYGSKKVGGTGLGLPISHRICVEHGGDLTYRSPSTGGAEFCLTLPPRRGAHLLTAAPPTVESEPDVSRRPPAK